MEDQAWLEYEKVFDRIVHELRIFMVGIESFFREHPDLRQLGAEKVHSTKSRLKDKSHLRVKIDRKVVGGVDIPPDQLTNRVTDLAGVRVLLLFQEDFGDIDRVIRGKIKEGDWTLSEKA